MASVWPKLLFICTFSDVVQMRQLCLFKKPLHMLYNKNITLQVPIGGDRGLLQKAFSSLYSNNVFSSLPMLLGFLSKLKCIHLVAGKKTTKSNSQHNTSTYHSYDCTQHGTCLNCPKISSKFIGIHVTLNPHSFLWPYGFRNGI